MPGLVRAGAGMTTEELVIVSISAIMRPWDLKSMPFPMTVVHLWAGMR
jgi:hypothetical protein